MTTKTRVSPLPVWTTGERMAKARDTAGLTQDEMADELGVSRRSIVRYETAERPPRRILMAYATVTQVPLWWLEADDELASRRPVTERERYEPCLTLDFTQLAA